MSSCLNPYNLPRESITGLSPAILSVGVKKVNAESLLSNELQRTAPMKNVINFLSFLSALAPDLGPFSQGIPIRHGKLYPYIF